MILLLVSVPPVGVSASCSPLGASRYLKALRMALRSAHYLPYPARLPDFRCKEKTST